MTRSETPAVFQDTRQAAPFPPIKLKRSDLRYGDVIQFSEAVTFKDNHHPIHGLIRGFSETTFQVDILPPPRGKKREVVELRSVQHPSVRCDIKQWPDFRVIQRLPENVKVFKTRHKSFGGVISFKGLVLAEDGHTWDERALVARNAMSYARELGCAVVTVRPWGYAEVWPVPEGVPSSDFIRSQVDDPYEMMTGFHDHHLDDHHLVFAGDNAQSGPLPIMNHTAQFMFLNQPDLREIPDYGQADPNADDPRPLHEQCCLIGTAVILVGFGTGSNGDTVRRPIPGGRYSHSTGKDDVRPEHTLQAPGAGPRPAPSTPAHTARQETPMTQPAPKIRTHEEAYRDLTTVTNKLRSQYGEKEFISTFQPIFLQHKGAQTDTAAADKLTELLRSHLKVSPKDAPQNLLFEHLTAGDTGVTQAAPAAAGPQADLTAPSTAAAAEVAEVAEEPAEEPAETPSVNEEPSESEPEDMTEPETDEPDSEDVQSGEVQPAPEAASQTAAAPRTAPPAFEPKEELVEPRWPAERLGDGWISQLAATLDNGGSVLFSLTRTEDELRVVIQPPVKEGESAVSSRPLTTQGAPAELDGTIIRDLLDYRAGRSASRQYESYLAEIKKAADEDQKKRQAELDAKNKAKSTAAKTKAPAPTTGDVTITTEPEGAKITAFDESGKPVSLKSGKQELKPGKYTVKASAEGFKSKEQSVSVKAGQQLTVTLKLDEELGELFS